MSFLRRHWFKTTLVVLFIFASVVGLLILKSYLDEKNSILTSQIYNKSNDVSDIGTINETERNFVLVIEYPDDKPNQEFSNLSKTLQGFITSVNSRFSLASASTPVVPIRFRQCGEADAFYDPKNAEIIICHELYEGLKISMGNQSLASLTLSFFLWHEIGHALIDVYDLAITGREEDVADQFAFYMLATSETGGKSLLPLAINISAWMLDLPESITFEDFADTHAFTTQRAINFTCWTYGGLLGKDQNRTDALSEFIPANRLPHCEEEYGQIIHSWLILLAPHVTEDYREAILNELD